MISKEDARATYTGQTFASTSCASCPMTTVTLRATIEDISATSSANGDTRSQVTFVTRPSPSSTAIQARQSRLCLTLRFPTQATLRLAA